jgi:ribosomal protein S18 acetylase RimI-like enzyme
MAVSILARSDAARDGIQPFEPARHLRQVADLVAEVFAGELDARGRSAVREMQAVGRLSPFVGGLMQFAIFEEMLSGYVWLEQGRVVGNVTLQPADYGGMRWRISNVAVASIHRGRGIARALMNAAIGEIARRGGAWSILQVRHDNPAARRLYDSLGYAEVCSDGIWLLPTLPTAPATSHDTERLQRLRPAAWHARYELAKSTQTPLSAWAQHIESGRFETGALARAGETLGRATGFLRIGRWGAWDGGQLDGAIETRAGPTIPTALRFYVRPAARGTLETLLVARGLADLDGVALGPVTAEHDGNHAEGVAALEAAGFRPQRILITMRRRILPADRDLKKGNLE